MKRWAFVIIISVLAVSGCAGAQTSYAPEIMQEDSALMGGRSMEESGAVDVDSSSFNKSQSLSGEESMERMVIKNGDLSVVVEDPSRTMDAISLMADELGGYVVSSNLSQIRTERGIEVPEARITIRVPAERLDEAIAAVKSGAGRVLSENVSGQDVTQEYTDLESRLRNLENAEAQLNEIMDEARKTEDVLSVYNRLVEVQEEIELIKGQMQYYERSAAMSSLSVWIQANEAVQPLQIGGWQPVGVMKRAIQALINTLTFFGDAAIWIVIYLIPVLLVLYLPVRLVWMGVSKFFQRRKKRREDQAEKNDQVEGTGQEE